MSNELQAADVEFHAVTGDENRTRALSFGSDGGWAGAMSLTWADVISPGWSGGLFAPLLTVVFRS